MVVEKEPHHRNDEAPMGDSCIDDSFRLVFLIYRGLRCTSTRPISQIWLKLTIPAGT